MAQLLVVFQFKLQTSTVEYS